MAIENMNGQFLGGKQVSVQYAFKKDGKGERHGTQAERLLAAQAKKRTLGFGGITPASTAAAYTAPPSAVPATPASAAPAPPSLPAGFAASNVIGAPGAYPQQGYPPAPPAGYPQQAYGQYPEYAGYDYSGAGNGYGAQGQQQQQAPPPPPIRMGFNQ
jgi:splicing factor 3B subunit 4